MLTKQEIEIFVKEQRVAYWEKYHEIPEYGGEKYAI